MAKHYVYGSGMSGCLYDNGPHVADDRQDAIDSLLELFSDSVSDEEIVSMTRHLKQDGIHTFRDPSRAGADYAEVDECHCENPEQHGSE